MSTDIHVPSVAVKAISRVSPRGWVMSQSAGVFWAAMGAGRVASARAGVAMARARAVASRQAVGGAVGGAVGDWDM